ncbi:hypothetical protein SBOR_3328 [Sclerotinia borealis F-4128]|uniref:Uncharacterized protein n=1 Tax=Sclerotinia borealis (strain F-4128) TaxID=1432307 RepID=W9CJV5_SCLBF|nr:hypothetical protein SBOR_3328 [Sclerotinia borealis F-4128]
MPPDRRSKKASQSSALEECVEKLCQGLNRVSKTEGREEINKDELEQLCEALHSTKAKDAITTKALARLLLVLENQDGERRCAIDVQTFCAVLNVVLIGDYCREGERVLVLLADELNQLFQSQDTEATDTVLTQIAKELDVGHLIEYFIDNSRPSGIRRWVGIIMQLILRGPEAVSEQFQHTPEDIRRGIGPLILSEGNEIIRLICGQLISALLNSDILPEELWPVRTNKKIYEDFPTESQGQYGWKTLFQQWVDNNWSENPSQSPSHMLYFSHGVVATPPFRLGTAGINTEMVLEGGFVLLLTTSTGKDLDQMLQVPCSSIYRVSVSDSSTMIDENNVYSVIIVIKDNPEIPCYLNSMPTILQQLCLTITSDIVELMNDIRDQCPNAEFPKERVQVSQAEDDILIQGKGSSPKAESRDRPLEGNQYQQTGSAPLSSSSDDAESNTDFQLESEVQNELLRIQADDNISPQALRELEKSQQNRNRKDVANNPSSPEYGDVANFSDSPTLPAHQGILPSSDEAVEPDDQVLKANGQALPAMQVGKARSQISQPKPISKGLPTNNGTTAKTATIKGSVSASMPNTQPSTSEAEHSQPNQNTDVHAKKQLKKYAIKPKPPIAVSKGKVESSQVDFTRTSVLAKTTTISKGKDGSAQKTAPAKTTSIYDLPTNEEDRTTIVKARHTTKGVKNKVGGSQTKGKSNGRGKGKNAKTHQKLNSTPVEVEEPVIAKRSSQRAAATQAKVNMSKINDLEDIEDDFSDVRDSGPAQPNVSRKRKTVEHPAEYAISEARSDPLLQPSLEKGEKVLDLPKQDAQESGLVGSNFAPDDPFRIDDLYTASPPASEKQQSYSLETSNEPFRKAAAMHFASQLGGLLSDDSMGDNKTTRTKALRKSLVKKGPIPRVPPPKLGKLKPSVSAVIDKEIPNAPVQSVEDDDSHHFEDENDQGPQLEEESTTKSEAQQIEAVVISCEIEVKENQKVGKTDGVKEVLNTKHFVSAVENENEPLPVKTRVNSAIGTHSHPVDISSNDSKQESIHKPDTANTITFDIHQPNPKSSRPTLPLPNVVDVIIVEEKKRKVATEVAAPSKRRRSIATNISENPPFSRPGPRPQTKILPEGSASKNQALLDDRSIRKPNLIHFGSKGAQNQGSSSTSKPVLEQDPELPVTTSKLAKRDPHDAVQKKRRHDYIDFQDETSIFVSQSPPKKRQSVSPRDSASHTFASARLESDSNSTAPIIYKSSSQVSRVNAFGSPLAQHTMPSIGQSLTLQQSPLASEFGRLAPRVLDFTARISTITAASSEPDVQNTPETFAPRVKVVSIPKARPAPPGESPIRYVPHTKTQHGTYEDVLTMENIKEEKALPDPFVEDVHPKSSGFPEQLRAGQTDSNSKADGGSNSNVRFNDPDKTLVGIEDLHTTGELTSPSELTSNSSFRSDDSSNTPTQELSPHSQWTLAVRPHYKKYADTVHKIADELVIRLANEEDASKLIVRQYNDNANSMLEGLAGKRDLEKLTIREKMENKKKELTQMYSEASKVMTQTEKDMKSSPMGDSNREWQERQEAILKKMKGGRHRSES